MTAENERYTVIAIVLHWIIAVAMIAMIISGMYMSQLEAGAPGQFTLYQIHKSVGITILILTLARCLWRVMNPVPPLPPQMNWLEKTASHCVHAGFYVVMIALPLTGWLYVSITPDFDVPTVLYGVVSWPDLPSVPAMRTATISGLAETAHEILAWLTLALLALHIAGAVKHEIGAESGVLKRMIPGLFGKTVKPRHPGRGYGLAFGGAGAVFALIVSIPIIAGALTQTPSRSQSQTALVADPESAWAVDKVVSTIAFSGLHDGQPYSGRFEDWDATIRFDRQNLQNSGADVLIRTGMVTTNQKLYTDSLKAPEWFDAAAFPVARAKVFNIAHQAGDSYTSTVRLTLKGKRVETPFPFTLKFDQGLAVMEGQAVFQRGPLDLGQSSDPAGDWVGEDVRVDVYLEASPSN